MWHRFGFLAVSLMLAAPVARAETPVVFDLSVRDLHIGTLSFTGKAADGAYSVSGQLESTGLVNLVRRIRYDGKAEGSLRNGRFTPRRYSEQANTGRRQSQAVMEYRAGVPQVKVYSPPRPQGSDSGLDPATQGGTVDPLTAMFATLRDVPQGQECNRVLTLFDGKRRSEVRLGAPAPVDGGIACAGEYRRLAGFSASDMAEKTRFPFTVQLVPGNAGQMKVAAVTMESLYGKARLKRR